MGLGGVCPSHLLALTERELLLPAHCSHVSPWPTALPTPLHLPCCSWVFTAQMVPDGGSGCSFWQSRVAPDSCGLIVALASPPTLPEADTTCPWSRCAGTCYTSPAQPMHYQPQALLALWVLCCPPISFPPFPFPPLLHPACPVCHQAFLLPPPTPTFPAGPLTRS